MKDNIIKIIVNNSEFNVYEKLNIIEACARNNITIPRFCYHEKLPIVGNCRMCLVEVQGSLKPVAACAVTVLKNMVIFTESKLVKKAREGILEFILLNHPLDCPICDQGGECDLQDQTMLFGNDSGRFYEYKRAYSDKNFNIFVKVLMTRCIHCTRCVRFIEEIDNTSYLGIIGRGKFMKISNFLFNILNSEFSGNVIDLCPVGALTSKIYAFKARPWELKKFNTIDLNDIMHINIRVDVRDLRILRVLPRYTDNIDEYWITDVTRFSFDGFTTNRLLSPYILNEKNEYILSSWIKALYLIRSNVSSSYKLNFLIGNFIDAETIVLLKNNLLLLFNNYSVNTLSNFKIINNDFRVNFRFNFDLNKLSTIDTLFIVGVNLRLVNPILNIRIKHLVDKDLLKVFVIGSNFNYNYLTYNLGNTTKIFINILKGKYFLNSILLKSKNILLISNVFLSNNFDIFLYLQSIIQKFHILLNFSFLNTQVTSILSAEFNLENCINNFDDLTQKNLKDNFNIFYFLNTDSIFTNFKKNCGFSIYQGHNNLFFKIKCNVLLPTINYLEKIANYINFFGYIQKTKYILFPPKLARSDIDILKIIFKLCYNLSIFNRIKIDSFFNNFNFFNIKNYFNFKCKFLNKIILNNTNFKEKITNIYMNNQIIRSSVIMLLRFKELKKIYTNFI